jgi:coenzyme F420-0:L-glutamate ligase / coenzyme F420-1:gamma-L-glutamate ligase
MHGLRARSIAGLPPIGAGDDLAALLLAALPQEEPRGDQLLAIAQKAVSKAEGAVVRLADVVPSARALQLAAAGATAAGAHELLKDPRAVQVVLDESAELLRAERGILICRTRHGFVCANAGVDASNAPQPDSLVLLPRDPDASARRIRARLRELCGRAPAVLISDSFGRAWRHGQLDVAVGLAGMRALDDWRGRTDATGRQLSATWLAVADAAAATADLVRGKDSGEPAAIIDGLQRHITAEDGPGAVALLRRREEDLFT